MPRARETYGIVPRGGIRFEIAAAAGLKAAAPALPVHVVVRKKLLVANRSVAKVRTLVGRGGAAVLITRPEVRMLLQRAFAEHGAARDGEQDQYQTCLAQMAHRDGPQRLNHGYTPLRCPPARAGKHEDRSRHADNGPYTVPPGDDAQRAARP